MKYPFWVKSNLNDEMPELKRVAGEFNIPLKSLLTEFKKAKLQKLSLTDWKRLENTESYKTISLYKSVTLAKKYDRDIDSIVKGFIARDPMPCPVILHFKDALTLIGGNTRLMVCRALNIEPRVLILPIYKEEDSSNVQTTK